MKDILLWASLGANLCFFALLAYRLTGRGLLCPARRMKARDDYQTKAYLGIKTIFDILPKRHVDLVMAGDSLTGRAAWQELLPAIAVSNRGIAGDVAEGLYNRLDSIVNQNPRYIFLMIGINDVSQKSTPLDTAAWVEKTVIALRDQAPQACVVLQSVLPVKDGQKNAQISALNQACQRMAEKLNAPFLDLTSRFIVGGAINPEYTCDGIHLTGAGYRVWAEEILRFYQKLEGRREKEADAS